MDLNKVMIIGRLTRDPEIRTIPSGQTVSSFSVATNFVWNDQSGNKQEKVEYHNVVAWRKLAEIIGQYLKKGSRIYLEGRLQTRSWVDQSGVKKYRTEIIADNMIMLDKFGGTPTGISKAKTEKVDTEAEAQPAASEEEINVEDIPF